MEPIDTQYGVFDNDQFAAYYDIIPVTRTNIFDKLDQFKPAYANIASQLDEHKAATFTSVIDLIADSCKTVIVEKVYIDQDYRNEFANFYCKTFQPYASSSQRLHFFSCEIQTENIFRLYEQKSAYLGYMILRPVGTFKVGRTVIKPPLEENHNVTCNNKYTVHLFGATFEIEGAPFMQQDARIGLCAQAAIWMAVNNMARKFGGRRYHPYEITKLATSHMRRGSVIPSDGLTTEQISDALLEMGYTPVTLLKNEDAADKFNPLKHISTYLDSGIPVILGISKETDSESLDHAVTVIGYTMDYSVKPKKGFTLFGGGNPKKDFLNARDWIKELIIHDDAQGPYERISINEKKGPFAMEDINCIIIPQPEKTFLAGHLADDISAFLISEIESWTEFDMPGNKAFVEFLRQRNEKKICLRTYLIQGVDFKTMIRRVKNISTDVKNIYSVMNMSRFVWVTEISTADLFCASKGQEIIGEVVIDYTSYYEEIGFLAIHVPGLIFVRDPHALFENGETVGYELEEERPYSFNHCH